MASFVIEKETGLKTEMYTVVDRIEAENFADAIRERDKRMPNSYQIGWPFFRVRGEPFQYKLLKAPEQK